MCMSKETLVFVIGILVFFSPFLGFPLLYKERFYIVVGVLLMLLGYRLRRLAFLRSLDDGEGGKRGEVFTESRVPEPKVSEDQGHEKPVLHI